ncbi:hypothetical protein LAUMK13_03952 [Mycobacterium innocens]|uniref:Uncharacterized protein n=1 Tax=Mycobacterium innocens TaxID=2341083 RepID=A0A498QCV3_9MYCO|nr:hypothetical protein [Mycobacterium kansasii]VBA42285.1 hypothetical protein LAUMK13_03952 [Mycobacterium innocens]
MSTIRILSAGVLCALGLSLAGTFAGPAIASAAPGQPVAGPMDPGGAPMNSVAGPLHPGRGPMNPASGPMRPDVAPMHPMHPVPPVPPPTHPIYHYTDDLTHPAWSVTHPFGALVP